MAYRKHVLVSVVLIAISGILFGCGDSTVAPIASTDAPLLAPSNVVAEAMPDGGILVTWDANTQPNLKGYNVYRFDTETGNIGRLNSSPILENSYIDQMGRRHVEYEYRVTAVSVTNSETGYTPVAITISVGDNPKPGPLPRTWDPTD